MDCFNISDNISRFGIASIIEAHGKFIKEQISQGVKFSEEYAVDSTIEGNHRVP